MQQKRIQNRIAESRWTQAYVVSAAALVWVIAGIYNPSVIVPGICLLLSTYLMMELNNANALIRIIIVRIGVIVRSSFHLRLWLVFTVPI